MLPNIFPFEGSTGPAQQPTAPPTDTVVSPVTIEVTMEQDEAEGKEEDERSRRSQTPSPEDPRPSQPTGSKYCVMYSICVHLSPGSQPAVSIALCIVFVFT